MQFLFNICTKMQTLNPLCTYRFSLLVGYNDFGLVHCIYQGVIGYDLKNSIKLLSLNTGLVLANS